jgi:hypothetical protein
MELYQLANASTQTQNDLKYKEEMARHFQEATGSVIDKLNNFTRFVSRQTLSKFLLKNEIFRNIVNIHGDIIECGVFHGGGLMTWANLSAIYEPLNHTRKIVGFDTFEGLSELTGEDRGSQKENFEYKHKGAYKFEAVNELEESIRLFDLNRPVGHIPKVELVKGNAMVTIPEYLDQNKHLVVALLYLDFDLYEPTRIALESFIPRMPKGSVIAFDELNQKQWPGETMAVLQTIGIKDLRIQRVPFVPQISFAVL